MFVCTRNMFAIFSSQNWFAWNWDGDNIMYLDEHTRVFYNPENPVSREKSVHVGEAVGNSSKNATRYTNVY